MEEKTKPISVKLDEQTTIQFETTVPRGEADIADEKIVMEYEKFSMSVEKIVSQTLEPLKKFKANYLLLLPYCGFCFYFTPSNISTYTVGSPSSNSCHSPNTQNHLFCL